MNNAQWKAINDYAEKYGYMGARDILNALKDNGTLPRNATFADLTELANGSGYNDMMQVLYDNL